MLIYIYKLAQRNSNFICIDIYNLEESAPRFLRLKEKFSNNMTEVYLLFVLCDTKSVSSER